MYKKTDTIKIIQAEQTHLNLIVPLFDAYRIFYEQSSNLLTANTFIEDRLKNNDSIIFIAANNEETLGFGFTQLYPSFTSVGTDKILILNDLYVDSKHRKTGIARQLMLAAKNYAIQNKYKKIKLETAVSNEVAQKLYLREGYIKEDKFITYSLDLMLQTNK